MRDIDLPLNDLVRLPRRRAELHPDRPAIDFLGDGEQVTERVDYAGLDRRVRALAALLQRHAAPGKRALLLLPSGIDHAVAFLACLYAGVITVPAYPPDAAQPQALRRLAGMAADATPALALTDEAGLRALDRLGQPAHPGMKTLLSPACTASPADWREHAPRPDDIAFLQYTSGSTSAPKGVMVSHANLLADKRSISATADERSEDRCFSWLPLFHDLGLILGLLQPLFYGLPLVLMSPGHFLERPRRWLEGISRHRASISGGPDFAYRLCAERLRPEAMAGVDLSLQVVARAQQRGLKLAPRQMFEHQTVASAAAVAEVLATTAKAEIDDDTEGGLPLTPIQQWFFEARFHAPSHWNQAMVLRLRDAADAAVVPAALQALLQRHGSLRLRFTRQGDEGDWQQHYGAADPAACLEPVDLGSLPEADWAAAIESHGQALQAALDIIRGPLLRAALFTGARPRCHRCPPPTASGRSACRHTPDPGRPGPNWRTGSRRANSSASRPPAARARWAAPIACARSSTPRAPPPSWGPRPPASAHASTSCCWPPSP